GNNDQSQGGNQGNTNGTPVQEGKSSTIKIITYCVYGLAVIIAAGTVAFVIITRKGSSKKKENK
ncbi:MAG: hypothetical protein IKM06_03375, partial [Clostridia bacterium]|nr:hypothetical protein [Clostridia bacterium]